MEVQNERTKSWPVRHRTALLLTLSVFLAAYVISYFWISRARYREYRVLGVGGFYYLPPSKLDRADRPEWEFHYFLKKFYAPLNAIDAGLFGGPQVGNKPLFEIGPPK